MPRPFFRYVRVHGATPAFGDAVQRLTQTVLWLEHAPASVEVSIYFIRLSQMHALNYKHRGIDKTTDVLTFPGSGSGTPEISCLNDILFSQQNDLTSGENALGPSQWREPSRRRDLMLDIGEIYVSVEDMWLRCLHYPQKNLHFHDYLQAALIHALLHALGYDHDTHDRWKKMSRREKLLFHQLAAFRRRWPGCLTELDGIQLLSSMKS